MESPGSASDFTTSPKTLTFDAGPEQTLDIIDRWREADTTYVSLRHPQTFATDKFAVAKAFSTARNEKYLVLATGNVPSEQLTRIVFRIYDKHRLITLGPSEFEKLSAELGMQPIDDDYVRLPTYIGDVEDRTDRLEYYFRQHLVESLTTFLALSGERLTPCTLMRIEKKWQDTGAVFIKIRKYNGLSEHTFRLVWVVEVGISKYAVLAYPEEAGIDAESIPRIVVRLIDDGSVATIPYSELDINRNNLVESISRGQEIRPNQASAYIGQIDNL